PWRREYEILLLELLLRCLCRLLHQQSVHRKFESFSIAYGGRDPLLRHPPHLCPASDRRALGQQFLPVRQQLGSRIWCCGWLELRLSLSRIANTFVGQSGQDCPFALSYPEELVRSGRFSLAISMSKGIM